MADSNRMKHRKLLRYLTILFVLFLALCISGRVLLYYYNLFPDPTSERPFPYGLVELFPTNGSLSIDSENILSALAQGDTNLFTNLPMTPETPVMQNQILWQQSDYLKIANAVFENLWGPTVADWDLVGLRFDSSCKTSPIGFSAATITYYKLEPNIPSRYDVRQLEINPQFNQVDWGEDTGYPRFLFDNWKNLNPKQFRIGADEAIKIAKNSALQNGLLSSQYDCETWSILWSDANYRWDVFFDGVAVNCKYNHIDIYVDSQTGEIHQGYCQAN